MVHSANAITHVTVPHVDAIRVMIVDDSAVVRGLVSRWISEEEELVAVEKCSNGKIATEKIVEARPDVVILDIEMPVMNGLDALPELLKLAPKCKFIMASTLTQRNAEISLQALALGATEYIAKPEGNRGVTTSEDFRKELIRLVKAVGSKKGLINFQNKLNDRSAQNSSGSNSTAFMSGSGNAGLTLKKFSLVRPRILVVGSSTGGPQALTSLLTALSPHLDGIPTLITQHMPPTFTNILAQNLSRSINRTVKEGEHGELLKPGQIYIAPGEYHMKLMQRDDQVSIVLDDGPQVNFCRPAVDPMTISVAQIFKAGVLNIILTGMGQDGAEGVKAVSAVGGSIIAQDEASSVVWGMPGAAAATGCCSAVLPLDQIGPKAVSLIKG